MRAQSLVLSVCVALGAAVCALAQTEEPERDSVPATEAPATVAVPTEEVSEEVLVTGERPGPGLWKISQGDHTLWILGTHSPLAKEMTWRSDEAEALIARSQAFLVPGGVKQDIDVGFFQAMSLFPSMIRAGKIPDGGKLADILPAEVYEKWRVLQQKYMPHETAETMRPTFAAQSLYNNASIRSGLEGDAGVWAALKKAARKHNVKIRTLPMHKVELKVKGGRAILKEFAQTPLAGVECLAATVERLESDFELLKARANAWAVGDVQSLRALLGERVTPNCVQELMNALLAGGFGQQTVADTLAKFRRETLAASQLADREWLEATQSALTKNESTFAVMPIGRLLEEEGYLSKLRALGYSVEEPG